MLELKADLMDGPNTFYPTLLWDQQDVVLVDAGLPGMASLIRGAIEQARVPFEKITRIIITHHDLDHIGSLGDLQRELPHPVQVLSHAGEVPYIQGELIPIKMTPAMRKQMEEQMKSVSEERRQAMQSMMDAMKAKTGRSHPEAQARSRFGQRLERRVFRYIQGHGLFSAAQRALVAVSGGPDSTALLLILAHLAASGGLKLDLWLAHFDHGLRGRAEREAEKAFLSRLAAKLDLPLLVEIGRAHV
jgi:predicted PP-loop superfamily ATPase